MVSGQPLVVNDLEPSDPRYFKVGFYAGAPLRTPEGHNVGSLCIIDDTPRTEFSPRERHTLKEFGVRIYPDLMSVTPSPSDLSNSRLS